MAFVRILAMTQGLRFRRIDREMVLSDLKHIPI